MVNLIVARSRNNVIGKDNTLPWRIKGELDQFKKLTTGNAVIMGRKTFESLDCKPLSDRLNIVVSSKNLMSFGGGELLKARSLEAAIALAGSCPEIYIIGGHGLYKEAIESGIIDRMYITEVNAFVTADDNTVFFPEFNKNDFEQGIGETVEGDLQWSNGLCNEAGLSLYNRIKYTRTVYVRKKIPKVFHKYITVTSDEQKAAGFEGDMADFAAIKLNEWKNHFQPKARIISIESGVFEDTVKYRLSGGNAKHNRTVMRMHVWLETR